jgi:hypothetical protein
MSRVDDRIRDEMDRLTRPVPADGVFEAVSRKRTRRRVQRRVQGAVLAVAVVAGSVAGGVGLVRLFANERAPSQGPTSPSPVHSSSGGPGVEEFPVICDESFLHADTDGDGNLDEVAVFSPGKNEACDSPEVGQHYVIHVSGNKDTVPGAPEPQAFYGIDQGLPECGQPFACRLLAAPDIDRDGADELAVEVGEEGSTISVVFYRLEADPSANRYSLVRMTVASPGDPQHGFPPGPATFLLDRSVNPLHSVACLGDHNHLRVLVSAGVLTDRKHLRGNVHQTEFRPVGTTLRLLRTRDFRDVRFGGRLLSHYYPDWGGLCGAPLSGRSR